MIKYTCNKFNLQMAMQYFPELFNEDLNLKTYDKREIRKIKNTKLKEIKNRHDPHTEAADIAYLLHGYNYLQERIEQKYKPTSEVAKRIYKAYKDLLKSISNYKFNEQPNFTEKKTNGQKQNKANKNILMEITLLEPILMMILCEIDALEYYNNKQVKFDLDDKLAGFNCNAQTIIEMLTKAKQELDNADIDYYYTRHLIHNKDNDVDYHFLGEKRKAWRKAKNNACHIILKFYSKMGLGYLGQDIGYQFNCDFKGTVSRGIVEYIEHINYSIDQSPYRYCFLSDEEKAYYEKEAENKKARKKELNRKNQVH